MFYAPWILACSIYTDHRPIGKLYFVASPWFGLFGTVDLRKIQDNKRIVTQLMFDVLEQSNSLFLSIGSN
jgi:hypothetical protein